MEENVNLVIENEELEENTESVVETETVEEVEETEEEMVYTVTLADGTELIGLRMNGDYFISETAVSAADFADNCSPVVISNGETEETHEYMELIQVRQVGNVYWFALRDMSQEKLAKIKLQADIEYIAMMADIEL